MDLGVAATSPALAALKTLASTSSGASTASARDAASTRLATSSTLSVQADIAGASLHAVSQAVSYGLSAADAAGAAGQGVLDLLDHMQQAATQAADPNTSTVDRQTLSRTFQASARRIAPTVQAASVGGVNLIDGSQPTGLKVALGDGAAASLTGMDLSAEGPLLNLQGATLDDADSASSASVVVGSAIHAAGGALAGLQAQAEGLAAHAGLLQTLGQSAAVPQTASDDGARLLALQVSQQLSGQSSSIANAAPQQILALFKG